MASKRRLRRKECGKKIAHDKDTAFLLARRAWKAGKHMHAYKCQFGHHWHLGHWAGGAKFALDFHPPFGG